MNIHIFLLLCFVYIASGDDDISSHPNWKYLDKKTCGRTKYDNKKCRIVNGKEAMLGEFPWIVRLGSKAKKSKTIFFDCAGTLISRYYVVTAAHCEKTNKIARVGENYDNNNPVDCVGSVCAPEVQDIPIERYIEFGYIPKNLRRDIMLAVLQKPATLNEYVTPACLPVGSLLNSNFLGQTVRIAGWGYTDYKTKAEPEKLQFIKAPVLNPKVCNNMYTSNLDESQLCVGYETGPDSCAGDSGGPLTKSSKINGKRQHYLLGVVSYGVIQCGDGPAVYTNVSYFMKEILDKIEKK